jgi:hypothetical protein
MPTAEVSALLPSSRIFVNTGESISEESLVEFRLLYQGELVSSGNRGSTAKEKHAIRKVIHPQLRRLWSLHQGLQQYARYYPLLSEPQNATEKERIDAAIAQIGQTWQRGPYECVPLVTPKYALKCSLDILLLRPADERFIFKRGDIDGQIKTLFDALRIPDSLDEAGGILPDADEKPFYCLLSDDRLITEVRVTDDQLLLLPDQRAVKATDVFAVIHVRINHRYGMAMDRYFD